MGPKVISSRLRQIASSIESNEFPDRNIVRKAVTQVVAALERPQRMRRVAAEIMRLALEGLIESPWDLESGGLVVDKFDFARRKHDPEDLQSALNLVKRQIDKFVNEIQAGGYMLEEESGDDGDIVTSAPTEKELRERRPTLKDLENDLERRREQPKAAATRYR
jgi:hypothetical protein